jgi:hypothetical protein
MPRGFINKSSTESGHNVNSIHRRYTSIYSDDGDKDCGCFRMLLEERKPSVRWICNKILRELVVQFARENEEFHRRVQEQDLMLDYRERQMSSVLLPSLRNIKGVNVVVMEHPLRRGQKEEDTPGLLDYWVDTTKAVLLIEFKYVSITYGKGQLEGDARNKWRDGIKKIKDIKSKQIEFLKWERPSLLKVCLMIVSTEQRATERRRKRAEEKLVKDVKQVDSDLGIERLRKSLSPSPNWAACWVLPTRLQRPFKDEDVAEGKNTYRNFPAVLFFAKVYQTQRSQ